MPDLLAMKLINVQFVLLAVNLVPIIPLDGGRILLAWLFLKYPKAQVVELYYWLSFIIATTLLLVTFVLATIYFFSHHKFIHLVASIERMALSKISSCF